MGLIKAAAGALTGSLADQWKDFFTIPKSVTATSAVIPAVMVGEINGRGSNTQSSRGIISNGSKIVVPEGYGLLVVQDGAITGFSSEAGAYIWSSDEDESQSLFAGDGLFTSLIKQSWERFKFGGRTSAQQNAVFVRLKELPNNKFGTKSPIYWDDKYLNAQVGAVTHGTYTVTVVDPIRFALQFVPAQHLTGLQELDLQDKENDVAMQLKTEVVSVLAAGFSAFANAPSRTNRMSDIQSDSLGLAKELNYLLQSNFGWESERGLQLTNVALQAIEYDEDSRELLKTVQRADALSGSRGSSNLQASVAEGIVDAAQVGGNQGLFGLGIASSSLGVGALFQSDKQTGETAQAAPQNDLVEMLEKLKKAADAGLISPEEYQAAKNKALGL